MIEDNRPNVLSALDVVMEGIENEIKAANRVGACAFERGDHRSARDVLKRAEELKDLNDRIETIRSEWKTLFPGEGNGGGDENNNGGSLEPGVRTPENRYYRPILEALRELGGSARKSEVLERVFQRMKDMLQEVDFEPLASTPGAPRWKNTAAWARNTLKGRGLMRKDSPHGVWEISDSGIQFLKRRDSG